MSLPEKAFGPVFLDIDLAMAQIGSEQTLGKLLILLEDSLGRDIPLVAQCLSNGDVPAAYRVLHAMKGTIPIFCVEALCRHVAQVEGLSKAGACDEVAAAYALLRPELEQLLAEVTAYLGGKGLAAR